MRMGKDEGEGGGERRVGKILEEKEEEEEEKERGGLVRKWERRKRRKRERGMEGRCRSERRLSWRRRNGGKEGGRNEGVNRTMVCGEGARCVLCVCVWVWEEPRGNVCLPLQ